MSWQQGHATIAALIDRGHLETISGATANGDYLVEQARRRLASATVVVNADHDAAFVLAYDGVRQAATALLVQQGLRLRTEGGHTAVVEAVRAQFGEPFHFFGQMRRIRNQLEYPTNPADLEIDIRDTQQALAYTKATIEAVEQLLPNLTMWQP